MRRKPIAATAAALIALAASHATVTSTAAGAAPVAPTVVDTIAVGPQPWGVAFSPDGGTAYVGNSGGNTVSVIDIATRTATTVADPDLVFSGPAGVAVAPGGSIFVTAFTAMSVTRLSASDPQISWEIVDCVNPLAITMRDDGTAAYIGCYGGKIQSVATGTLADSTVAQGLGQVRDVAYVPQGAKLRDDIAYIENVISGATGGYFRLHHGGMTAPLPGYGMSVAIDRDGTHAYVGDATGILSVFDIANKALAHTIDVGGDLQGIALSQDGRLAYVTDNAGNRLKVVDLDARTVLHTITVGAGPLRVALSPDERTLLVTNNNASSVSLIAIPGPDCGPVVDGQHLVATAAHLASVGAGGAGAGPCGLGASYLQTADITLPAPVAPATSNHIPIGDGVGFTGVYDGGGHTIAGLVIDLSGTGDTGLFDSVRGGGLVKDLSLTGADVRASGGFNTALLVGVLVNSELRDVHVSGQVGSDRDALGGLVGYALDGVIRRASATVTVTVTDAAPVGSSNAWVGGLIGYAQGMTIEDSTASADVRSAEPSSIGTGGLIGWATASNITRVSSSGTVDGKNQVGGLIGAIEGGTLSFASSSSLVTDATTAGLGRSGFDLGGLIGWAQTGATLVDTIATGDVTVSVFADWVGGLTGYASNDVVVERSIATGRVAGSMQTRLGGLVGEVFEGITFIEAYWDITSTGQAMSAGGTPATTAELASVANFTTWPIVAGWEAHDVAAARVWGICSAVDGGYPFLLWRFTADPCGAAEVPVEHPAETPPDVPSDDASDRTSSGPDADGGTGDSVAAGSTERSVACSPSAPRVGDTVACALRGGAASEAVEWRASYNPTFASGALVLDADGSGTFVLVIPSAALGSPVVVEVIGWDGPTTVSDAVGPLVPSSIPAGQGLTSPSRYLGLLVCVALIGMLLSPRERRAKPGRVARP